MNDPADSVDGSVDRGVYEAPTRYPDLTVHRGEFAVRDDDRSEITEVRIRRRNVTLDWQGVDSETRQTLRTARSGAKRGFTMALTRLSDALVAEGSIEEVTKCERKMEEAFEKFKMACDSYRDLLVEDDDLDECGAYFRETEPRFITMKDMIKFHLESNIQRCTQRSFPEVTPEDSISEVAFHKTTRTRSSWTSRERSSNAKLIAATKRASLLAEESLLEEKYRLEKMELDLNKEKKALQLRTEIAKVEAKERACIGFTFPSQINKDRLDLLPHQDQLDLTCKFGVNVPDPVFVCWVIVFEVVYKCQEIDIL